MRLSSLPRTALLFALCLATPFLVTACVAVPENNPAPPPAVVVQHAPPAEIVETPPPPPGPREIWVWQRGHWRWDGYNYRWAPGHWVERPEHVSAWIPPHWDQRPNGWVFVEGHWQ